MPTVAPTTTTVVSSECSTDATRHRTLELSMPTVGAVYVNEAFGAPASSRAVTYCCALSDTDGSSARCVSAAPSEMRTRRTPCHSSSIAMLGPGHSAPKPRRHAPVGAKPSSTTPLTTS